MIEKKKRKHLFKNVENKSQDKMMSEEKKLINDIKEV